MIFHPTVLAIPVLALVSTARAWDAPDYGGFRRVWHETFAGPPGVSPNGGNWNIINGNLGVNNELQTYTSSNRNVQLSGGSTVQLVPWRDGSAQYGWTSGRIESRYVFVPGPGQLTRVEAVLRFGNSPTDRKQGIWPAFWMLGNAVRDGLGWPACGELDIVETINGQLTGFGTVHCSNPQGGICNEPYGIGGSIGIPDQGWHNWRVEFDRRPGNWWDESISWYMNDRLFHQIRGSRIQDYGVWSSLCHSPLFFILNVAVGGNWPGYPNGNTLDGYGSMLEVAYVAHYST